MNHITKFVEHWSGHGYEKGEMQPFWLSFLRDVLNVSEPEKLVKFEVPVKLKHTSFIDAFLPDTKIIIEQKSLTENLEQEKSQSDGSTLTPYEQAQRYGSSLPYSMRPRWIIVSNFAEFLIYDMETLNKPIKILLSELPTKFHIFDFMVDLQKNKIRVEMELSLKAGEIVGRIYNALRKQYINPESDESLKSLNKLCVRLVFCLYAESSGIFGGHKIFRDYLQDSRNIRQDLILLFEVLNTPREKRDPYLTNELQIFPYVNGGLFDEEIEIPNFTPDIKNLLLDEASSSFNWAGISPTIFGAVFESTLNPITRRSGGMRYTSIENIHKVIDPLFMDNLQAEFQQIKHSFRNRKKNLLEFQNKLSKLKFFDPTCGSGNFLTETYLNLRRLENEILKELQGGQIKIGDFDDPIKVSINQFYGIEINDFACTVSKTALWIAELQMIQETADIVHKDLDFLPLKSYANIHEGNALRMNWNDILPPDINYIIGNPPFVGKSFQNAEQKLDMKNIFNGIKNFGNLDYVACWYKKAADFIANSKIQCAFVSTNSICQGIAVAPLWNYLLSQKIVINFAHQTFHWNSESNDKAAIHCVIVGFSLINNAKKKLFNDKQVLEVDNINPYLPPAPNIIVEPQTQSSYDVPPMIVGSCPTDGGNLIIEADDYDEFIKMEPASKNFIRPYIGSEEFINGKQRFCLWLKDCPPSIIRKMPLVMKRIQAVKDFRLASKKLQTRHRADTPYLFAEERFIETKKLFIPMVSSSGRDYIPIGFVDADVVVSNLASFIPNANNFLFGILSSNVFMAWLKVVGSRLKSDYRFSATLVYNTFPFCHPNEKQRKKIEQSAQLILDVRKKCLSERPESSTTLADLYDPLIMPKILKDAHRANDDVVKAAYNFPPDISEFEIVSNLMKLYQNLVER